ncbi:MAG: SMC-Scp complex subunit ScpB [Candidatus Neomarinimicrobiota bacterium]|nr:MAG: SMC-Scp complex subunit ScpB [Candidatus Marinimicrobia bacterium TMED108]RCL90745.1 MAG: SMC-Scp complex subunit ScpB [bacterium]|tara:strand:+ start:432 stop:992 length:561 start_codon:yes stop_codon:yes gene_type:complete
MKDFEQIIEALLFASPEPLTQKKINTIFDADPPDLDKYTEKLKKKYQKNDNAFEILNVAGGYQIRTRSEYDFFIRRLIIKSGQFYLSQAALESLSIIAYKQPISRLDIEGIRGVDCAGVLKTLLKKTLIKISGREDSPGRPLIYKTTDNFLKSFGLNKLSDLPKLKEISELIENEPELIEQIDAFK